MSVEVIRSSSLAGLPHGFLGRRGGVSVGELAGLNVGYGSNDERSAIDENRRRAVEALLPGAELATVHQVHGADVVHTERPWPQGERPHADAMVTDRPGLLLAILTADCAPVLLADAEAGIVGAAHAGWRGALAGVTDSTIEAMERLGASRDRLVAAVGPCIGQPSYEVDTAFQEQFLAEDARNGRLFADGPSGKPHFDLPGYVGERLRRARVGSISDLDLCTYCDESRLFSYRRSLHHGEHDYGRQISAILLT